MIVRISGVGQYELDDDAIKKLDQLDTRLTDALNAGNEEEFKSTLHETISFVQSSGTEVPDDRIVPSEVIIPPDDVTLSEARDFFTDEGLMAPLPA
jgi:hypothetical protein